MHFLSPIWLIGLLPWATFTLYLFTGQRERQSVPFLPFWSGPIRATKSRRALRWPPGFVLCLLISILLALLAAAGPARHSTAGAGGKVTIILDRGITMSPNLTNGEPFRGVISLAKPEIARRFGGGLVELLPVPGAAVHCTSSNWSELARQMSPTAIDTQDALEQAVAQRLRDSTGPIIVLTDRSLNVTDNRLVQIPPDSNVADIGIVDIAARVQPTPQVMIRLRNQSPLATVQIRITAGEQTFLRTVQLPAAERTRNYFFDMPKLSADSVMAEIDSHDAAPVNDRAWLVREKSWPKIEARTGLPASVSRLVDVYSKSRPPGILVRHISVSDQPLPQDESGVYLVTNIGKVGEEKPINVIVHPIAQNIALWGLPSNPGEAMPNGFRAIVTRGAEPIIAVRDGASRQVWVNMDLEAWSRTPDFVIFFANVFDWIGTGQGDEFSSQRVSQLPAEWIIDSASHPPPGVETGLWPGLYRRADGDLRAINAPDVIWSPPPTTHWQEKLASVPSERPQPSALQSWFCVAALLCAFAAATLYP